MPVEFNSLHRLELRASVDDLEAQLTVQDSLELAVCSKMTAGVGGSKSVTIGLHGLVQQGVRELIRLQPLSCWCAETDRIVRRSDRVAHRI